MNNGRCAIQNEYSVLELLNRKEDKPYRLTVQRQTVLIGGDRVYVTYLQFLLNSLV